jgi:glycerophosphoryl diester phosphodiesterase
MKYRYILMICVLCFVDWGGGAVNIDSNISTDRARELVKGVKRDLLRFELTQCLDKLTNLRVSNFSISHRGAPLYYPEHTREGYIAASNMGAGLMECDVALTKDLNLVCRHSHHDLHRTTDVLINPKLSNKCSIPFSPANSTKRIKVKVQCNTSDFTLAEYKTLNGKMDNVNIWAETAEEYIRGVFGWREKLFGGRFEGTATLMSHRESISLFKSLGLKMIPELKYMSSLELENLGISRNDYRDAIVLEYIESEVLPHDVYLQSSQIEDIEYWNNVYPAFSAQTVYLMTNRQYSLESLQAKGVNIIAPIYTLLIEEHNGQLKLTDYAKRIQQSGFEVMSWTVDRRQSNHNELEVLDILHRQLNVSGVFSDWPVTTSFYANCMID